MAKNMEKLIHKTHTTAHSRAFLLLGILIITSILCINLVSAWDLSTANYSQRFLVSGQDTNPHGIFLNSSGTKMYMIGNVNDKVYEYNLSEANNVVSATYSQGFSVVSGVVKDLFFNDSMNKMYSISDNQILEYNLSSPNNVLSATLSANNFSVATNCPGITAAFIKPDGKKMYVSSQDNDIVCEYNLSASWNVSSATYSQNFSVATQDTNPHGIFLKSDGLKMYIVGDSSDTIYEYDLTSAWNVVTSTYLQNLSVNAQDTFPTGIFFKSDGTKMYISGYASKYINEYNLSGGIAPGTITVNLTAPVEGTAFSTTVGTNFTVNYTSSSYNLTNTTYHIWNSTGDVYNNSVNISIGGTINSTTVQFLNFTSGNYKWNAFACGENATGTFCNWADSNLTFSATLFSETNTTYNTTVFETGREYFNINITTDPSISSVSAKIWYNGTKYTSSVISLGSGIYQAYNNIDISLTPVTGNKTFLWEFTFVLTSGTTSPQNSSTFSHQVNRTFLEYCGNFGNFTTRFINFTTYEAENPYPSLNASFKSSWDSWLGGGNVKRNSSWENVSEMNNSFPFCLYPVDKTFNVDTQIEIDAVGYAQNYHYLDDAALTNSTTEISLYLLNDSDATLTVLKVQDGAQKAIEDVTIQIQLYDVGTDTFYTVGMAKTAFNGEDLVYLNWYDSLYKFVLTQNGEVIKQTTPYKITETPQLFEIITGVTFPYDKFRDFVYSLVFNNNTNNFVLTFTKPSGLVDAGCLRVIKRNVLNDTEICNICETSSSATLYCNIAGYGNGTYYATFYATGSLKVVKTIYIFIGTVNEIYDLIGNLDGTIYAILFAGIVLAMFLFHPIFAVIGIMLGALGAIVLGFQPLYVTEFVGIIIAGVFVIWIIKR